MESVAVIPEDALLHDEDFPDDYIHMIHPNDYKITSYFDPIFLMHERHGRHQRLIVRSPWRLPDATYTSMSFVCDTGAPKSLYLSVEAREFLSRHKMLKSDESGSTYVECKLSGDTVSKVAYDETPQAHKSANIIGLSLVKRLTMHVYFSRSEFNSEFQGF